jgi:hypothetical protein
MEVDTVARTAPARKTSRPSWSAPLRPNRSPIAPAENSRPANTSEYAATTHWSWELLAWRCSDSVGMATFRLELPMKTISRLRHSTTSVHQRRGSSASSVSFGREVVVIARFSR